MAVVDRCICHNISFEEIRKVAVEKELTTVEQLQTKNIWSTSCRLCEQYIEEVLVTGQASFILFPAKGMIGLYHRGNVLHSCGSLQTVSPARIVWLVSGSRFNR